MTPRACPTAALYAELKDRSRLGAPASYSDAEPRSHPCHITTVWNEFAKLSELFRIRRAVPPNFHSCRPRIHVKSWLQLYAGMIRETPRVVAKRLSHALGVMKFRVCTPV